MSGYAMEWAAYIADQQRLDPAASWVLVRIAEHAHRKSGRANPSARTIAAETRFTERGVLSIMARLREAKVVECETSNGRSAVWWFPGANNGKHFRAPLNDVQGLADELSTRLKQVQGYPRSRFQGTPERRARNP